VEHVVFYPAADASGVPTPAFRRLGSLEDAVRLVEHLRNVEGISEVSVHALTEVPLAFKAWYRVEMPGASGDAPAQSPAAEAPAPSGGPAPEAPVAAPEVHAPEAPASELPAPEAPSAEAPAPEAPAPEQAVAPVQASPADAAILPVPDHAEGAGEPALAGPDGARSLGFFS
jgi:hypothetical protein